MSDASNDGLLLLSPQDNVAVALRALETGQRARVGSDMIEILDAVPMGHKVAVRLIRVGQKVIKYGAPIGSATVNIQHGRHVHTQNLKSDYTPTYTLDGDNPYLTE